MSTYTDLHNRIKENVTILRRPGNKDDGMTPQKVQFINPENQFYGTFNGTMNVTGGVLSGLSVVGGTINGATIKDACFLDGDTPVQIGAIASQVDDHETRVTKLETEAKAISAAHDKLSSDLSSEISALSGGIDEKLASIVSEIKRDIGGVVGDVDILSSDLGGLSSKVESLSTGMLNGVVYKGTLLLKQDVYLSPFEMFKPSSEDRCCLVRQGEADEIYQNGWMYRISLDHSTGNIPADKLYVELHDLSSHGGGMWLLGEGDFIIVKNHDISKYSIKVGEITLDDLDRINAQDEDDVHDAALKTVSSFLDQKIGKLSDDLSSEISATQTTISEVSAETLISASDYVEKRLAEVSGSTLVSANEYTNGVSSELCTAVGSKLVALSGLLSAYSNELCSEISTEVDASYVHKAGDTIAELCVAGALDVTGKATVSGGAAIECGFTEDSGTRVEISEDGVSVKTHAGVLIEADEDIELKTGKKVLISASAPLEFSGSKFRGTFTDGLAISSDGGLASLSVNGKTLQSTLDDLDGKKLDVDTARDLSSKLALSDDISWDLKDYVNSPGYLVSSEVGLRYDSAAKRIYLITNGTHHASAEVDTTDFIKDGMLKEAHFLPEGHDGSGVPEIQLIFNTDAGADTIYVPVGDLVDIYKASEDGITLSDSTFSLKYDDIKEKTGLNALSTDLYGEPGDPGTIGRLQDLQEQIEAISVDNFGVLAFTGHLVPDLNVTTSYSSVGAFLQSTRGEDAHHETLKVKNGASYNIYFKEKDINNPKMVSVDNAGSTLLLGNGDVIIVHDHSNAEYIDLSNLLVATDENPISGGNVYILKAGVSRYEFEAEAKQRADDDNFISSWIISNFVNTSVDSYASTTTLRQDVSASQSLSVASNAYVLSDLSVAGQLFANSILSVDAARAVATTLSAGVMSSDTLTSRTTDVAEKLSATSAYIDWLSVGQQKVKCLEVETELSVVSFSKLFANDTLSSVADLCTSLSTGISSLTQKLHDELSVVDVDPLNSLNADSKLSAVISAVVVIRDTLSAMRGVLDAFL